jgi:Holliday junction resolvase-like predicted endonuclease
VRLRSPPAERPSTRAVGNAAERRVRRHFRLRGYRVLAANAWVGGYELDLVVRRGAQVVVCEVKAKGGENYGDPAEMVTPEKARRIRRAAEAWLAAQPELGECEIALEAAVVRGRTIERMPIQ